MKRYELVLLGVCVALVILIVLAVITGGTESTFDNHEWEVTVYCVEMDDTLWKLGKWMCPDTVDVRDWIEEVLELNNMEDSYIKAGQSILLYKVKQ